MKPIRAERRLSGLQFLIACVAIVHVSPATGEEASADQTDVRPLPQYRFKVGEELVYRLTKQQEFSDDRVAEKKQSDNPRDQMEWRVVVVSKNDDGSWRLLLRNKIAFRKEDGSVRAKRNCLGYCDLHPNGSYTLDEQTSVVKRLIPYELFCRLPDNQASLKVGWGFDVPILNYVYRLRAENLSQKLLRITGIEEGAYTSLHHWQQSRVYDFDTDRGLVTSITSDFKNTNPEKLKSRRVIELDAVVSHDAEWIATFRAEAELYLDDYRKWLDLCYAGVRAHTVDDCRKSRAKARAILEAGRNRATFEMVWDSYDTELLRHDADEQGELELVAKRVQFFKLAPSFATDWQAEGMDGSTFRLGDQRGKPVVLFFWGTNCEYCVLMGPQLKQLAAELNGKNAVVLGMFVRREDRPGNEEDEKAKFLIDHAFRGFAHLDGAAVEKLYRLVELNLGHPSMVILDRAGKPHEVQFGYSADIVERVRKTVADLR